MPIFQTGSPPDRLTISACANGYFVMADAGSCTGARLIAKTLLELLEIVKAEFEPNKPEE